MTSAKPALSSRAGKVFKRAQIAQYQLRLVKRTNHVFAQRVVDAGFATNGRIDLRQQGRRHLHKRHATHVAGSGKTCHITDHATA